MSLTNAGRDLLLSGGLGNTINSLGLAGPTGTELSGGTPAYARKAVTWTGTSGVGIRDNTADITFDIGGSSGSPVTVARVLLRASGSPSTDYGWFPVGGTTPMIGIVDAATDAITSYAHGLAAGNNVYVDAFSGAGLPSPYTAGTMYYVINVSTNAFQLATTAGGAAVNVTASGELVFQRCIPEVFSSQGTYTFATGDVDLYAVVV